jgi:hypothetical protein
MAYIPETKDKTPRVSPAAQRVLGPEDPKARKEVEAQKNQKFSTWDQIGMAADMLPGGAIAAGGVKAAAKKGPDIYKMIKDALEGFRRDGDRGAQSAIVNWVSSTDTSIITKAQEYLDSLSGEALKSVEPVRKALNNAYNQFISPKGGHTTQWKDPSTPSAPPKPGSALEYVQQQKKIGKDIEASKATRDVARPPAEHKIEAFVKDIHSGRVTRQNEKIIIDKIKASPEEIPDLERAIERMLRKADDENTSLIISLQKIHKHIQTAKKEAQSGGNTFLIPQNLMPPAGRMKARDMPSPSGKGRLDQKSVHGKAPLDDLSQMVSDVKSFDDAKLNSEIKRVKDLFEQAQDPLYHTQYDERLDRYYTLLLDEIRRRGL